LRHRKASAKEKGEIKTPSPVKKSTKRKRKDDVFLDSDDDVVEMCEELKKEQEDSEMGVVA